MVFKAKLVALLSLEGGWKHVMTMISHLLLQAFRCNTKRCLGLCSIVSGGGVGVYCDRCVRNQDGDEKDGRTGGPPAREPENQCFLHPTPSLCHLPRNTPD